MARRFAVWLLLFVASAAGAVPAVPDTPAGRAFSAWLAAFNAADAGALKAFGTKYRYAEAVDDTLALRDYTGGYTLVEVRDEAPERLAALLVERDAGVAPTRVTLALPADAGAKLALTIEPQDIARLADTGAAVAALEARAKSLAAEDRYSGAYLVARNGKVLAEGAYGFADRAKGVANTTRTKFRYGSAGKMFTAVAVLQLVAQGKVALDAPLATYLPDFPNAEAAAGVTIRHLLTHTGGTGGIDVFGPGNAANRAKLRTHADYVAHHGERALAFAPGSRVDYSNFGFVLLGAVVERVSGSDYYDYVRAHVLAPAGMDSTGFEPESVAVPGRAIAYTRRGDAWADAAGTLPYRGMAAGGGYTTVGDLLRFARALQSGKLLPKALVAQATSPQMDEKWYGFGFIAVGEGGLRRFGHGGDAEGMNADFRVFPESGWVLVSLANVDPPAAYRLFRFLEPRMPVDGAAP